MPKTRFVCVSDTHNAEPGGAFKLPKGDVLLHAGDMTNQGSYSELQKAIKWLEQADFEAKIVIAGFHNQNLQDPPKCQQLLEASPSIMWLKHGSAVVNLQSPTGPRTTFKIFGSPYSPANGTWAFGYGVDEASHIWEGIPADADIILTHTPPMHHCDDGRVRQSAGCPSLQEALRRIRPRLAVCGHVHEGRGVDFVRWSPAASASDTTYREESTKRWEDPGKGNKKISLVDLTIKRDDAIDNISLVCHPDEMDAGSSISLSSVITPDNLRLDSKAKHRGISNPIPSPAAECQELALNESLGYQETCIVNAAIMASSWPHGPGGKKFNKPIVVDIDLPTWEK
ncbi:hypothetical protein OIDMADRAFT_124889 [Oidiodendron maius Zn]|uniref:Calcineurin-like phosphoesterase domain-containing protein n=1 Tax=Oidiodendron maius (strain Zn) TaxID=913774 RepID=A0A0C3CMC1_OIDMZ|nr:hypothetical protein OIDMADRAFT_124889 [Oidiodendron maius Zn]